MEQEIWIRRSVFIVLLVSFLVTWVTPVHAQVPAQFNMAITLNVIDPETVDGDIVSLGTEPDALVRSQIPSDERMYGVIVENPMVVYKTTEDLPVVRTGIAFVNVTTLNGPIKVGDYITSSTIPGKGAKSDDLAGYQLGVALAPFEDKDGTPITVDKKTIYQGKVKVTVGIGPASPILRRAGGGLFGTLTQVATAVLYNITTNKQVDKLIRYLLAILVAIASIAISFLTFGRNITRGIEAIGRNPLARLTIQSMIVVNVVMTIIVALGGVVLALVIISF